MYQVLDVDLSFKYEDLKVFIPVVGSLLAFIIFWFTWMSEKFQKTMMDKFGEDRGPANIIIYTKILGGLSMGILPAAAYMIAFPETTLVDLGLGFKAETAFATIAWTLGLGAVMVFLVWNNARKPETLAHYPQIRAKNWTKKMMGGNLLGWTTYLFGYEFMFRGVLFFPLYETIGLGALKYFILKVDPKKRILFDPKESIDFNGNTGPFIQYTYARIQSILRKADFVNKDPIGVDTLHPKEKELLKLLQTYPVIIQNAAENLSPALVANFTYELVKSYNSFYQSVPIFGAAKEADKLLRVQLSYAVSCVIKSSFKLLGIEVPERM